MNVSIEELLEAGVHFGHQKRRWNPKSKKFVFDHRNGVSIIDLEKTHSCLARAAEFIEELVAEGKEILIVGTKRQAQEITRETATAAQMPFCASRWLGGCLTNFPTIKASLEKYKRFLAMDADGSLSKSPNKKEVAAIRREMSRMNRNFEGMLNCTKLPSALLVIDSHKEAIAVAEARKMKIPVVAIVDTNSDPSLVDYPIPGNDDAAKAIRIITDALLEAIERGLVRRESGKGKKGKMPMMRQDFSEIQPEVTIASDINLEEAPRPAAAKTEAPKEASAPEDTK